MAGTFFFCISFLVLYTLQRPADVVVSEYQSAHTTQDLQVPISLINARAAGMGLCLLLLLQAAPTTSFFPSAFNVFIQNKQTVSFHLKALNVTFKIIFQFCINELNYTHIHVCILKQS